MAKKSYKVKVESVHRNVKQVRAEFSIGGETIPAQKAGEQPTRVAKTAIQIISFDEKEFDFISSLKPGTEHTITIE